MEINAEKINFITDNADGIQREIKVKMKETGNCKLGQLFQLIAQNRRFSQGLHEPMYI